MKSRFFALLFIAALAMNIVPVASAESVMPEPPPPANALVGMLPASDAVITFDTKRFFSDALPKVLNANQPMLGKIVGGVNDIASKTGIDLRKFENVAIGATMKTAANKNLDVDFVAIARGEINAGALVAMAKMASSGKYRELKIADQTAYVFSLKDAAKKAQPKSVSPKAAGMLDNAFDKMFSEIAVASTDRNTLMIGSLARITQTLEKRSMLSAELSTLMNERATSILAFAVEIPDSVSKLIPAGMDEIGKQLAAIRVAAGGMDVTPAGAVFGAMVRTHRPQEAKNMSDMLQGLQMMFGPGLSSSKRPDQQLYGRLLQGAKIAHTGNDVNFNLTVAQADLDSLVGQIK